ncbi:IS4 family transposase [Aurantibacillus circumpalustris]|uniref:IS4 family transposase n=1 Tax=Aurantibacillus circumpalustris TaxID=3036359 RepID=UPI00295BC4B8|nr:IS4 family transposase [Aurantibacillus circumpalustris]
MRTGNHFKNKIISLKERLKELRIYSLSHSCNFQKRRTKKIDPLNLILSFYNCNLNGSFSLSGWAFHLSQLINKPISKQAIFERVDADFINLCRELLNRSFNSKRTVNKFMKKFSNVYIQDSTCIHLPSSLYEFYQGNKTYTGNHSVAKIQVIYNLMKNTFEELMVTSFTRNDQAASADILQYISAGDLIVRDLGYFVLRSLKEILKKGAHFICPLRKDVHLFFPHNNQLIDLKKLLKNKKYLKQTVLLGKEEKVPVTLFAIKLDRKTASYRQKCAIQDRDRRKKLTIEKLHLLGWDVFVSSCADLEPQVIQDIYKIRWHIEIVFKSWKSHLKLEKNIPKRLNRPFIPEAIIYLTLLLTVLFIMPVYRLAIKTFKGISLIKTTRFIVGLMPRSDWTLSQVQLNNSRRLITYETRNRANFTDKVAFLT